MMASAPHRSCVLAGGCLLAPAASAHLVATDLGPLYDRVLSLLTSPELLAPPIALALWSGFKGARHARWSLFVVTGTWLLGECIGVPALSSPVLWTAGMCLVLGVLLALDAKAAVPLTVLLAVAVGWLGGVLTLDPQVSPVEMGSQIAICASVFILSALTSSLIVPLHSLPSRIAIRVAGSWLAALGLLMFGWAIRAAR